jgi:hypothetical protein
MKYNTLKFSNVRHSILILIKFEQMCRNFEIRKERVEQTGHDCYATP